GPLDNGPVFGPYRSGCRELAFCGLPSLLRVCRAVAGPLGPAEGWGEPIAVETRAVMPQGPAWIRRAAPGRNRRRATADPRASVATLVRVRNTACPTGRWPHSALRFLLIVSGRRPTHAPACCATQSPTVAYARTTPQGRLVSRATRAEGGAACRDCSCCRTGC